MQPELVNRVFMFVSCLKGPTFVLGKHLHSAALNPAVGIVVRLKNEIHADKALHHFINHILYVTCEKDLGDFFPKLHPIIHCCATKGNRPYFHAQQCQ